MIGAAIIQLICAYIKKVICLHFCTFKKAGTKFLNTHVHFLGGESPSENDKDSSDSVADTLLTATNPNNYTGLGHDDEVFDDASDLHHNTVSTFDSCEFRKGPVKGRALSASDLNAISLMTAWFHPAPRRGKCPEGFYRVKCDCGDACYTFDSKAYDRWRESL